MRLEPYIDEKMKYDEEYINNVFAETDGLLSIDEFKDLVKSVQYLEGCEDSRIESYFYKILEHIFDKDFYYFKDWSAKDALINWFQLRKEELREVTNV